MPRISAPLTAAVVLACALSCAAHAQTLPLTTAQAQALGVTFTPVQSAQTLDLTVFGRAVPARDAEFIVAAPYPGVLRQLLAMPGTPVKAGQALARFDSPDYHEARSQLEQARAQAALAADSLKRDTALQAEGIIPAARLRATQSQAEQARSALQARTRELGSTGLRDDASGPMLVSSDAGTVINVAALAGQRVNTGDPLFRVARSGKLEIEAALPATAPAVAPGDAARVPTHDAQGTVLSATPTTDGSGAQRLRIGISQAGRLRLGQAVTVQIHGAAGNAGAPAWRVPTRSVVLWQGHTAVFAAGQDQVTLTPVELLSGDDDNAIVRGPLAAGARVVGAGTAALKGMLTGGE